MAAAAAESLTALGADALRKELAARGLSTTGSKSVLRRRLQEAVAANADITNGDSHRSMEISEESIRVNAVTEAVEPSSKKLKNSGGGVNYLRSVTSTEDLLQIAADNGGKNFNIFLQGAGPIPRKDPRKFADELRQKISSPDSIRNFRYTRSGCLLFNTWDVACAVDICRITEFFGVETTSRVIWENITNRFLVFRVPVSYPLDEIARDFEQANNIRILELRRFIRSASTSEISPVLITSLGEYLPSEIKLWYEVHRIQQFIDRPRQCLKCFQFSHSTVKCQSVGLCVTCGACHEGSCPSTVKCALCSGDHRSDYLQCPTRLAEADFLQFKCKNFLSFVEARRLWATQSDRAQTYASITSSSCPVGAAGVCHAPVTQEFFDLVNNLPSVITETISQQLECLQQSITDGLAASLVALQNASKTLTESLDNKLALLDEKLVECNNRVTLDYQRLVHLDITSQFHETLNRRQQSLNSKLLELNKLRAAGKVAESIDYEKKVLHPYIQTLFAY